MADAGRVTGRLIIADEVVPGTISIADGVIASVDPDPAAASGPIITPGFIDIHVHGFGGHDAMGGRAELVGMSRDLLRRGVTSFLPTAVTRTIDELRAFADETRAWMASGPAGGADPVGFNLEGPFLAASRRGAHPADRLQAPDDVDDATIDDLIDGLRVITVAPELPGALALIERMTAAGVRVSLGHSAATLAEARAGYAAGATSTTHLFNAMSGVTHRDPGLALAALLDDAVWTELIADGHHVDRSVWPLITRLKPSDRLILVSDAIPIAGSGATSGRLGELDVVVAGGRATLAGSDTIAGSVIALDAAVAELVGSGTSLSAAVRAASMNPATLLGLDDRGSLEVGRRADLVELGDDLDIGRVMLAGAWIDA